MHQADVKDYIDDSIYSNGNRGITGTMLNGVLNDIVDAGTAVINVNNINNKTDAYSDAATARAAVPNGDADTDTMRKLGAVIAYKLSSGWIIDLYIGSNVSGWSTASNWQTIGPVSISQNASTQKKELKIGSNVAWEADLEPTANSHNLVESGGVYGTISKRLNITAYIANNKDFIWSGTSQIRITIADNVIIRHYGTDYISFPKSDVLDLADSTTGFTVDGDDIIFPNDGIFYFDISTDTVGFSSDITICTNPKYICLFERHYSAYICGLLVDYHNSKLEYAVSANTTNISRVQNRLNMIAYVANNNDFVWSGISQMRITINDDIMLRHYGTDYVTLLKTDILTLAGNTTGFTVDGDDIIFPNDGTFYFDITTNSMGFSSDITTCTNPNNVCLFERHYAAYVCGLLVDFHTSKLQDAVTSNTTNISRVQNRLNVIAYISDNKDFVWTTTYPVTIAIPGSVIIKHLNNKATITLQKADILSLAEQATGFSVNGNIITFPDDGVFYFNQLTETAAFSNSLTPANTASNIVLFESHYTSYYAGLLIDFQLGKTNTSTNGDTIFDYNPDSIYASRIRTLKKQTPYGYSRVNTPLVLSWFSDLHAILKNMERINLWNAKYASYIDDVINCGDTIRGTLSTYEEDVTPYFENYNGKNILMAIGNHDVASPGSSTYRWDGTQSIVDIYNKYIGQLNIGSLNIVQPADASTNGYCYYYKDYAGLGVSTKGIRLIVLDSVITDTSYQTTQLTWFASVLNSARAMDYSVVIATHYMPTGCDEFTEPNGWSFINKEYRANVLEVVGTGYMDAVESFMSNSGKFVCWLCGHTHADHIGTVPSYPNQLVVAVTCARDDDFQTVVTQPVRIGKAQDGFNFIEIDTYYNQIKLVRIGYDIDALGRPIDMLTVDYHTKKVVQ